MSRKCKAGGAPRSSEGRQLGGRARENAGAGGWRSARAGRTPRAFRCKGAGAPGVWPPSRGGPGRGAFKPGRLPARATRLAPRPPSATFSASDPGPARCGLPWLRVSGSCAPSPGTAGEPGSGREAHRVPEQLPAGPGAAPRRPRSAGGQEAPAAVRGPAGDSRGTARLAHPIEPGLACGATEARG